MSDMDPAQLSVSQLKKIISECGLSYAGLVEKSELIAQAREALKRRGAGVAKPKPADDSSPSQGSRQFSKYMCNVIDTGSGPKFDLAVVILHGFGATASDFTGLCPMLASQPQFQRKRIRWVLPQAPSGSAGVPAWWDINVQEWMSIAMGGASETVIAQLIRKQHPGLSDARRNIIKLVDEVVDATDGVSHDRLVLGGFSQGAMTAIDAALNMPATQTLAGVLSMSGAPIVVDEWAKKAPTHSGLNVLITHGKSDNVLPFAVSGWLKDLLDGSGLQVTTAFHNEAHTLGPSHVVESIRDFLAARMV